MYPNWCVFLLFMWSHFDLKVNLIISNGKYLAFLLLISALGCFFNKDSEENNKYFSLPQFDEQKDQVAVEQILRVVFLDVERPTPVTSFYMLFLNYYNLEEFLFRFAFYLISNLLTA